MERITIETDLFEHREVKANFINPCCFGEDFAVWLTNKLDPLTHQGFHLSEPIQEDYGWALLVSTTKESFFIALSYVGNGPQEPPPQWVVSVCYGGLNPFKRWSNPGSQTFLALRDHIWQALRSDPRISVIEEPN